MAYVDLFGVLPPPSGLTPGQVTVKVGPAAESMTELASTLRGQVDFGSFLSCVVPSLVLSC
jgi:hypothetical protein